MYIKDVKESNHLLSNFALFNCKYKFVTKERMKQLYKLNEKQISCFMLTSVQGLKFLRDFSEEKINEILVGYKSS